MDKIKCFKSLDYYFRHEGKPLGRQIYKIYNTSDHHIPYTTFNSWKKVVIFTCPCLYPHTSHYSHIRPAIVEKKKVRDDLLDKITFFHWYVINALSLLLHSESFAMMVCFLITSYLRTDHLYKPAFVRSMFL